MPKKFTNLALSLFISLVYAGLVFAQFPQIGSKRRVAKEDYSLRGPVKRLEVEPSDKSSGLRDVYFFDVTGKLVEQLTLPRTGSGDAFKTVYSYDKSSRLVGNEIYRNDDLIGRTVIKRDSAGNEIEESYSDADASSENPLNWTVRYGYSFDSTGRVSEKASNLLNVVGGSLFGMAFIGYPPGEYRELFGYDDRGHQTEYKLYFPKEPIPFSAVTTQYDANGRKTEETIPEQFYRDQPPRIKKLYYSYNKEGDPVEVRYYEPVNESTKREVGDRFKIVDGKGTVLLTGRFLSDKPNMILWSIQTCRYEYDTRGNWINVTCQERLGSHNLSALVPTTTIRKIAYYPN